MSIEFRGLDDVSVTKVAVKADEVLERLDAMAASSPVLAGAS
jgi:hypothetical protein